MPIQHGGPITDECGASSVEYGLIVFAIAAFVFTAIVALGGLTSSMFSTTCSDMKGQMPAATASC